MTEFVVETVDGTFHYLNLDEMKYVRLPTGVSEYKPSGFISFLNLASNAVVPIVGTLLEVFISSDVENQTISRNVGMVNAVFPVNGSLNSSVDLALVA